MNASVNIRKGEEEEKRMIREIETEREKAGLGVKTV